MDGFEVAMNHQREQARAAGKFKAAEGLSYSGVETRFDGYDQLQSQGTVTALYIDGTQVESVSAGQQAIVVLDARSEEHTSELQSLMRISYAVFCLNKKKK